MSDDAEEYAKRAESELEEIRAGEGWRRIIWRMCRANAGEAWMKRALETGDIRIAIMAAEALADGRLINHCVELVDRFGPLVRKAWNDRIYEVHTRAFWLPRDEP